MSLFHTGTVLQAVGRDPIHPFPARMAPGIALGALNDAARPLRVLDPMMGSGTVLAVAQAKGHHAIGVDIDPLSVLLSKVWTTAIDVERARIRANQVFQSARTLFRELPVARAYPHGADEETRRFVRYWFDPYARRQLEALSLAIRAVRDRQIRDVLWCALSRLIITKQAGASLARDLAHSRPHKTYQHAPAKPFNKFLDSVNHVLDNCVGSAGEENFPESNVYQGDARALPLGDKSIDLIVTSPPYLNAIDYLRCSKFSLVWLGYTISKLRDLRSISVGTEVGQRRDRQNPSSREIIAELKLNPALPNRQAAILARYVEDMHLAIKESVRVLVPGGKAIYVLGENTVRRTYIPSARIVALLAQAEGLSLVEERGRDLPENRRYLPPPSRGSAALDTRMRREVVLTFSQAG